MRTFLALLLSALFLCGCSGDAPSAAPAAPTISEFRLRAGTTTEVSGRTFDQMVTVVVDPASTRSADIDLRSSIDFTDCEFQKGLTIQGDYHAMIHLGSGCRFADGAGVVYQEATPGSAQQTTLEDNLVKLLVSCEGVRVDTTSAMGLLTDGPDVTFNGSIYSKAQLAPEDALLGIYSLYQQDALTYVKLAIGSDDSVVPIA